DLHSQKVRSKEREGWKSIDWVSSVNDLSLHAYEFCELSTRVPDSRWLDRLARTHECRLSVHRSSSSTASSAGTQRRYDLEVVCVCVRA
uniref:HMG box domain-containing protein n=1 Tax=Mesocestoides corti TaxID=53468 RepID=A0A5K3FFX9_MESCO